MCTFNNFRLAQVFKDFTYLFFKITCHFCVAYILKRVNSSWSCKIGAMNKIQSHRVFLTPWLICPESMVAPLAKLEILEIAQKLLFTLFYQKTPYQYYFLEILTQVGKLFWSHIFCYFLKKISFINICNSVLSTVLYTWWHIHIM